MPHTPTIDDFYAEATEMLAAFNTFIDNHSLTENIRVDHFCYKCGSHERFESLRALFEQESHFIFQSLISQRRIAVIKLKKGNGELCPGMTLRI
jgi:predicted metalloenzyme YecM